MVRPSIIQHYKDNSSHWSNHTKSRKNLNEDKVGERKQKLKFLVDKCSLYQKETFNFIRVCHSILFIMDGRIQEFGSKYIFLRVYYMYNLI